MEIEIVRGQKKEATTNIFIPRGNSITMSLSFALHSTCHFIHGQFQFSGKFPDSANDIGAGKLFCTQIILFLL